MPMKPRRPCRYPGCVGFCEQGQVYCPEHIKWSADRQWREVRVAYLRRHPLCVQCQKEGRLTAATVVDHIIPHRGDQYLFWDQDNWQALCKDCHDKKTGRGL